MKKAMISSTARDLPEHRRMVMDACQRVGFRPIMMEHLPAQDRSANDVSIGMVEEADVYLGIFAHAYGSNPDNDARSYTEIEFDKAVVLGIPVIAFFADENSPWPPRLVDKGEKAEKLDHLKQKVAKNRIVQWFKSPEDLRGLVIHALGEFEKVQVKTDTKPGLAPPLPSLVVGRDEALQELKKRLGIAGEKQEITSIQILTAVRGWPGVGKTTIAAALAHDSDIRKAFPDGVLWTSLGQKPDVLSELATWGRALGSDDLLRCRDLSEATTHLAGLLRNKRTLLIVDDAWEAEHVTPFKAGGAGCAMLVTTRVNSVAQAIAPTPAHIYRLAVLTNEKAIELLKLLAPAVVAQSPQQSLELVRELEGLPLAIQVAGRLLHVEASYGFGVSELLEELRAGKKLLEAKAPADQAEVADQTVPSVAALLQKSTDRLDPETRERFAYLGAFAPKPATFDLRAMKAVWQVEDPKPTIRVLVDRGLLELVEEIGRYQMHALLALHARSLCSPE